MKIKTIVAASIIAGSLATTSVFADISSGLTLTSNASNMSVWCHSVKGPYPISSSPLTLPFIFIPITFGTYTANCYFYNYTASNQQPPRSQDIGSATIIVASPLGSTATISNVTTKPGYTANIQYPSATPNCNASGGCSGISVTLNN